MQAPATRRDVLLAAAAAAAGTLSSRALGARTRRDLPILGWQEPRPGVRVTPENLFGGNVLVLADAGEALVVDSKAAWLGGLLRHDATILATGEDRADHDPPITLVNTHHHGDHTGGNASFVGRGPTIAHEKLPPRVRDAFERNVQSVRSAPSQAQRSGLGRRALSFATETAERADTLAAGDFAPKTTIAAGKTERMVGGLPVELHHFGAGHTDNDVVVRCQARNAVHTGDLVFNGLFPYNDADGGVDQLGWIASLESIRALCDAETIVVPGHGPVGDRSMLDAQIEYFVRLREAVQREIDAGATKEETMRKTFPFMEGLGFDRIRPTSIAVAWDELTAGG